MKRLLWHLLLAVCLIPGAACRKTAAKPSAGSEAADSRMMVLETSPYWPAVDLYLVNLDTFRINDGPFTYPGMRQYVTVPSGRRWWFVNISGAFSGSQSGAPLILKAGASYTLFNPIDVGLLIEDDLSLPPDGYARVRVIQGATYGAALDFLIQGGDTLAKGVSFKAVTDFRLVKAGDHTIQVRDSQSPYAFKTSLQTTLQSGKNYTLLGKTMPVADTSRIIVGVDLIENK